MDKGEKVTNTYFAVKMKNGEYANDYWGYSSNFTENETRDALVKKLRWSSIYAWRRKRR